MKLFTNPLDPDNIKLKITLSQWITAKWLLSPTAEIEINEMLCAEPSCIHTETIFKISDVQDEIKTVRFYKISKPLVYIRKWDFDNLQESSSINSVHKH